jgi:striatin 1/3/4
LAHPTLPIIITAHEDSNIRFYDSKSGQLISEMVGHKDAVSCLALDPSGLYFMSGGHDSSLRVWDVQTKHCVQEIPTHRKKYDESIHAIAYHPTKSMVASGGADSIIKLFQ